LSAIRETDRVCGRVDAATRDPQYTNAKIHFRGIETCLAETLHRLQACDLLYISFDVNSIDHNLVSYGTGTPIAKGFDPNEVLALMKGLFASDKVVCMEWTEVNPLLDTKGNRMAETAFRVLREIADAVALGTVGKGDTIF